MKEEFLHYVWKTKSFRLNELTTISGKPIDIVNFGTHNQNAGPDFLNARIVIENHTWVGHVEIHLLASDWTRHRHDKDEAYQNVILHVVLKCDVEIRRKDGTIIPCISLKDRITPSLLTNYPKILHSHKWIPCESLIVSVPSITKEQMIGRMMAGRLYSKASTVQSERHVPNNWEEQIYQMLCRSMGLKVNAIPMNTLASRTPWHIVEQVATDVFQLEALLFGQSGLLQAGIDQYSSQLLEAYIHLRKRYHLHPGKEVEWKFSRMRPRNFPTIRLAQLVRIIHQCDHLEDLAIHQTLDEMYETLSVEADGYWLDHYRFGCSSKKTKKRLGKGTIDRIISNAILPIRFLYAQKNGLADKMQACLSILEQLPSERNSITERWRRLGLPNRSAADSQGLMHLKKTFCDNQRCLSCPIGHKILTQENDPECTS